MVRAVDLDMAIPFPESTNANLENRLSGSRTEHVSLKSRLEAKSIWRS